MKPWAIAAGLVVLLVGGALLWARTERQREEGRAQAGRRSEPASSPPARVPPVQPLAPALGALAGPPFADPVAPGPREAADSLAAGRPPGDRVVDWEAIPLDREAGESLGDIPTRQTFSAAMRSPPALSRCTEGWEVPPGIPRLDMDLELRVRSVDDALVVEDVRILEANVSDASVERCVIDALRGRRAPAPGIRPGQAFRLKWRASKTLR